MRLRRTWMAVAVAASLGVLAGACGDDDDDNGGDPGDGGNGGGTTTVSFATDVQPILSSRCVPCHATAWGSSNVATAYTAARAEVTPNNPATSELLTKGNATVSHGGGDALSDTEATTITTWINEGALNN